MEGDLSLVSVPDLLQMMCLGGYSRDIHLFDDSTQVGVIAIRSGRIERCFGFGVWGEEAFYKLVNLRRGRYKVNDAQNISESDATLATYPWQALLIEAARRQDEAERLARSTAATGHVIAFPTPPAHAATFELSVRSGSAAPALAAPPPPALAAPPPPPPPSTAAHPRRVSQTMELTGFDEPAQSSISQPDITYLLEEATACYLRRDLARTEEILQQCLAMRPGDKRVLQNLERVRRRKPI